MTTAVLQVIDLHVWYAQAQVLNGISLYAMPGETIVLLGRKDSGQHAVLRAIFGQTYVREGSVRIVGQETIHAASHDISLLGLRFLTTESNIFTSLTCEENLLLPPIESDTPGGGMSLRQIYDICPDLYALRHTLGVRLSRAEQLLLAIARILRTGVSVLLLDDIANGLAPVMVQAFSSMILELKQLGYTIIMAEQQTDFCGPLADRFYVMDHGEIIDTFDAAALPERQQNLYSLLNGDIETWSRPSN